MIQSLQALWKQLSHQSTIICCYVGKGNLVEHYKSFQQWNDFSKVMNHHNSFLFAGNVEELLLDCTPECIFCWFGYLKSLFILHWDKWREVLILMVFFFFLKRWKKETEVAVYSGYFVFYYSWIILYFCSLGCITVEFYSPKSFLL